MEESKKGSYPAPKIQTLCGRELVESLGHAVAEPGGNYTDLC